MDRILPSADRVGTLPARRLNYQHLLYFWTVVRTGSIARACEELHLSPPAVSAQLKTLEARLGEKLLARVGRRLVPTEAGRLVQGYAEEIFGLGRDLLSALAQRPTSRPRRLVAGIDDVMPKEIAYRLLQPALGIVQPVRLMCREGSFERLAADLVTREVDVVLSDAPISPSLAVRAYNHLLGRCGVLWMGLPGIARRLQRGFPRSLHGIRVLLPTDATAIRRAIDQWFERHEVRPMVVGEFEDYALLREFARAGHGIAPVPEVIATQFHGRHRFVTAGRADGVEAQFYAITLERRLRDPALMAVAERAADSLSVRAPSGVS